MNKVKTVKLVLSILITFGFLYILEKVVGFEKIIDFFQLLTLKEILLSFTFYILSYLARTIRWQYTLSIKNFYKLFKLTVFNTFFNIILPFRTGEISFFYMLKKEGIHIAESTMSFIITRFFDGISLIGVFLFAYLTYKGFLFLGILAFALAPFSFLFLLFILKFINHDKVKEYHQNMINFKSICMVYILSVITLIFKFSAFYIILPNQSGLNILQSILASSLADLTTVLPIHGIAGVGTYETGYSGILLFLGVPKETALLSGFLVHTFIIIGSSILAVAVYLTNLKKI
jgi:uncharacterized membrane protein YbhN (UPF0104 family)